jgi:hypothetical protein
MLASILLVAMIQHPCPITIGIGRDGTLFSDRFYGWYRITPKTLESDLKGGCYNDANPSPITSVKVAIAADAPPPKIDLVFSILARDGWPKGKVNVQSWTRYPQKPLVK